MASPNLQIKNLKTYKIFKLRNSKPSLQIKKPKTYKPQIHKSTNQEVQNPQIFKSTNQKTTNPQIKKTQNPPPVIGERERDPPETVSDEWVAVIGDKWQQVSEL